MKDVFLTVQIVTALITIVLVVIQSKGTGIGSTFGGDMGFYGTKRGAEKMLFVLTIILASTFVISSLVAVLLS
jgi:protein translocase SecG subunit